MASPLSPASNQLLNTSTPPTTLRSEYYEVQAFTMHSKSPVADIAGASPSGSCETEKPAIVLDQENLSPTKSRHSRVLSGAELSPLKILSEQSSASRGSPSPDAAMGPPPLPKSPRKMMSPVKRFPVKVSNPLDEAPSQTKSTKAMSLEDAMEDNSGLKHAIEIFEDEDSIVRDSTTPPPPTSMEADQDDEAAGPDDTMVSTFSTFSAVPNMTMLAKLGQSPAKGSVKGGLAPRTNHGSPSAETPRANSKRDSGNTTNLLMDFTEQLRNPQRSPPKNTTSTAYHNTYNVASTPSRRQSNLLDFDIPPMPTPRSVPSITPRELESLKSNFLSEISSLKATLSGKEAEVQSLKTAVGDAEKRVGESLEQVREEKIAKEQIAAEKDDWESRGREMETVLRKVRDEIVTSQKEQEELEQKLDESEKRREAAEMLHQEAESKMAGMRAGRDSEKTSPEKSKSPSDASSNHEVEVAVERVARELHGLYKSKHETKVSALKKSYESRWQKKVKELEERIEELNEENERLRNGRDTTLTKVEPGSAEAGELKAQAVKDSAAMKELNADIQRLEAVVSTVQRDNEDLRGMLEKERVEKGELVQLAEEMMSMQSSVGTQHGREQQQPQSQAQVREQQQPHPEAPAAKTPKTSREGFRSSAGRSGLRAPGSSLRPPQDRGKTAGGLPRPGGGVGRSGIMTSIEKMGSYRGRGGE